MVIGLYLVWEEIYLVTDSYSDLFCLHVSRVLPRVVFLRACLKSLRGDSKYMVKVE